MKKMCVGLLLFLISSIVFSKNTLKIGAYAGYFFPSDSTIKEVYTKGEMTYGAKIGLRVWKGLHVWLSGMQFKKVSETIPLGDITTVTLNPLTLSLRYTIPLGTLNPYLGGGYTYIFFKEKSDIGNISGEGKGYSVSAGFEVKLSSWFYMDFGITYSEIKVRPTEFDIQLGGLQPGITFLVVF